MYNIWPQNIVIITIVSLQGNTTSFLIIKYLTITYSTFPFPGLVVMPYVFVAGTFLYELSLSYDSYLSFSYCRNIVGENIFLDTLLGIGQSCSSIRMAQWWRVCGRFVFFLVLTLGNVCESVP